MVGRVHAGDSRWRLGIGAAGGLRGASIGYVVAHVLALPTSLVIGWRLTGIGAAELPASRGGPWRPPPRSAWLSAWPRGTPPLGAGPTVVVGALALGMLYFAVVARLNPEFVRLAGRELGKLRPRGEKPASVAGVPPRG